jgi:hypothetical protein
MSDPAQPKPSTLGSWCRLLRAPNLLTAPGDPLAGFLLASLALESVEFWRMIPAAAASLLLYAAGLIQNDLAGLSRDRVERPERPLPSGAIRLGTAKVGIGILGLGAMGAAAMTGSLPAVVMALSLVVLISLYNHATSELPGARPINMGLCRGVSLLLGASAAGGWGAFENPSVLGAAAMLSFYVAALTHLASHETETRRVEIARWLPAAFLAAGFGVLFIYQPMYGAKWPESLKITGIFASLGLALLAVITAALPVRRLVGRCDPARIGRAIGALVRNLLPIQAALAAAGGSTGLLVAAALLVAWPIAGLLGKRFASS